MAASGVIRRVLYQQCCSVHYHNLGATVKAIDNALEMIFAAQLVHVVLGGVSHVYLQERGVSIGLACAAQVANIWLLDMDERC